MKRIILAALAAVIALGAFVAPAHANRPSYQDRADALAFARDYWQDRGRDSARYGCPPRRINIVFYRGRGYELGKTYPGAYCSIFLNSNADWNGDGNRAKWWNTCATVIHEWGHLVGRGHNDNPESIMARYADWNYEASWYPFFPDCRYEGDDRDNNGYPEWRKQS